MSKTKGAITEILLLLTPLSLVRLRKVDKRVDEKINGLINGDNKDFSYMSGYETLDTSVAEEFLNKTFEARKSLEDKAKTNVFGVTIAVSLMIGLSQVFYNNFPSNLFLRVLTIILAFYSLTSMVLATILSLMVLGRLNRVYDLNPSDKSLVSNFEKLRAIAINAELNMNYNIKRHNYLYSSYGLITTFLLSLSILFLLVVIPYHGNTTVTLQKIQDSQNDMYKEVYKINGLQQTQNHLLTDIERKVRSLENELTLQMDRIKRIEEADKEALKKIKDLSKQNDKK
jgi:hypothetical protein